MENNLLKQIAFLIIGFLCTLATAQKYHINNNDSNLVSETPY